MGSLSRSAKNTPGRGREPEDGRPVAAASIRDVAEAANVSIATVSRVINETGSVSAETAARVRDVIKRINYVPNPFAQGLITQASRVLGLLLPDIHGEFFSELLKGADAEAHARGYSLLVTTELRAARGSRNGMSCGFLDGLAMMISDASATLAQRASSTAIPTVVLDADLHDRGIDSVIIDNAQGARQAVEHLLERASPGSLYFVGGGEQNIDTGQRAAAFTAVLKEAGVTPRPDQITYGSYTVEWGLEWLRRRIERVDGVKGIAVLAGNDEIAIGVLQAAQDAGLSVPGDILLVGFDDTRLASLIRPRLSTVRVPMPDVGAAAVRLLVRRIADRTVEATTVHMATSLVVRDSSVR